MSCSRYDLQIRYLPEDFLESLKEDRTTLLYFYQQVKVLYPPVPITIGKREITAQISEVPVQDTSLGNSLVRGQWSNPFSVAAA